MIIYISKQLNWAFILLWRDDKTWRERSLINFIILLYYKNSTTKLTDYTSQTIQGECIILYHGVQIWAVTNIGLPSQNSTLNIIYQTVRFQSLACRSYFYYIQIYLQSGMVPKCCICFYPLQCSPGTPLMVEFHCKSKGSSESYDNDNNCTISPWVTTSWSIKSTVLRMWSL